MQAVCRSRQRFTLLVQLFFGLGCGLLSVPGSGAQAVNFGSIAVGTGTSAAMPVTITLSTAATLSSTTPFVVLTEGVPGQDFASAGSQPGSGDCSAGASYTAGQSCTVNITFNPQAVGRRRGAVQLNSAAGAVVGTGFIYGTGVGAQLGFQPYSTTQLVSFPNVVVAGVAVDGAKNIFFSDSGFAPFERPPVPPGGIFEATAASHYATVTTFAPTYQGSSTSTGFSHPTGIALDGAGDLFVADTGDQAVKEVVATDGVIPANPSILTLASGFTNPVAVGVDGAGNVFVVDSGKSTITELTAASGYQTAVQLAPRYNGDTATTGFSIPTAIALDASNNVWVADSYHYAIKEILAAGGYNTVTTYTLPNQTYGYLGSLALDPAGDAYACTKFSETALLKVVASDGAITPSSPVNALPSACYLIAIDGAGNLYNAAPPTGIAPGSDSTVTVSNFAQSPSLTFQPTQVGSTSADSPNSVFLTNTGNAPLTLPVPSSGADPSLSAGFTFGNSSCPQVSSSSGAPGVLAMSSSCQYEINFAPVTAGTINGAMSVAGNFAGSPLAVSLSGVATAGAGPATHFALTTPAATVAGVTFAMTVMALDANGNVATSYAGTVHFTGTDAAAVLPADTTLVGGQASLDVTLMTPGNRTITATDKSSSAITGTSAAIAVSAPSVVVTTISDGSSGVASNCPSATNCSLRDALKASAHTGGNITFDPTVFATAQTISVNKSFGAMTIPANTSIIGATSGTGASLTNLVTIASNGNAFNSSGLFAVAQDVSGITLSNLNLSNGATYAAFGNGGAINNLGSITVIECNFTGNLATAGGAIYNSGGLKVIGSAFLSNQATGEGSAAQYGGAIYNSGTLVVNNSTFSGNLGNKIDSGIYSTGNVQITNSTFDYNFHGIANVNNGGTIPMVFANTAVNTGCVGLGCPVNGMAGNLVGQLGAFGVLANNGGPTMTILPDAGGAAMCGGSVALIASGTLTDERGYPRTAVYKGVACVDVGAVQTSYAASFTMEPPSTVTNNDIFPVTLRLTESGLPLAGQGITLTLASDLNDATLSGGVNPYQTTDATGSLSFTVSIADPSAESNLALVAFQGTPLVTMSSTFSLVLPGTPTPPTPPVYPGFVVTTASDTSSGVATNCPSSNNCSLRDALAASAAAGGGNITFSSSVFAAATTISLNVSNGAWSVPTNTTITGSTMGSGATLTNLVTLQGAPAGSGSRSGILSEQGTMTVVNLNFANTAGYSGGAISNNSYTGTLTVSGCNFTNNTAIGGGGAIYTIGNSIIRNSTFTGNSATAGSSGGAIYSTLYSTAPVGSSLTITGSTFAQNSVTQPNGVGGAYLYGGGGAIFSYYAPVNLTNDTFYQNAVTGTASFGANDQYFGGGAVGSLGNLSISDSTFAANAAFSSAPTAGGNGGAIFHIPAGTQGSFSVSNSLFSADGGSECSSVDGACPVNGDGGNILDPTGALTPFLPLANYSGSTQTLLPLPNSAAVCAGLVADIPSGLTTDQRGYIRTTTYGSNTCVDAGAVQTGYAFSFSPEPGAQQSSATGFPVSVTVAEQGNPIAGVPVALTLAPSTAGVTLLGIPVTSASNGVASGSIAINTPTQLSGETLTAFAGLPFAVTSSSFSVAVSPLSVAAVSPSTGPIDGNTSVIITGTGFTGATSVTFGGTPAFGFSVISASQIIANSPAGTPGTVNVVVTTPQGNSATTPADLFTYVLEPTTLTALVSPSASFLYAQQPTVAVRLNARDTGSASAASFTATLDATTALTVVSDGTGVFNLALSGTPLLVGTHTVAVAFAGTTTLSPSSLTFTLTVLAPTFTVNTTSDDATGTAANCPSASNCSLRDALAAAVAPNGGAIVFDPTVFASAQTITLTSTLVVPANTSITGRTTGAGNALTNLVTISGGGSSSNFGMFSVGASNVTLANLIVANGYNQLNLTGGALTDTGSVAILNSTFQNNTAYDGGGAILVNGGTLTVEGSTFAGNTTQQSDGGAIFNFGSTAISINNSTFTGNSVPFGYGGAINTGGPLTINNSTFSGNYTGAFGGAINIYGPTTITNSLFSGDLGEGDETTVENAVPNECHSAATGVSCPVNGVDGNVVDITGTTALLSTLGNHGGPTPTLLPLPGSSAICAASPANSATLDQRGIARPSTDQTLCYDAGAVQTAYALMFAVQPSTVAQTAVMSPSPKVAVTENGLPLTAGSVTIPLTLSTGPGSIAGGSAATSIATGIATYPSLTVSQAGTGDVLEASLPLGTTQTLTTYSSPFNVTAAVVTVTSVSPASGVIAGGKAVTIVGSGFSGATAVHFGANPASSFTVNSATEITAISPAASYGAVDVTVTTPQATSPVNPNDRFSYYQVASTSLTPNVSPAGPFVYGSQPTVSVTLAPSGIPGVTAANFTATLDGTTSLTVTAGSATVFNITLPAAYLQVGNHSIVVNFNGVSGYPPSSTTVNLTVTVPSVVVTDTALIETPGAASNCPSASNCGLNDALAIATAANGANITFDPTVFASPTTIIFYTNLYVPSNTTITGLTSGSGPTLTNLVTLEQNYLSYIFVIAPGATGIAISNLNLEGYDDLPPPPPASLETGLLYNGTDGGGILNASGGSLAVNNVDISNFYGINNAGTGIYNTGTLVLTNSTLSELSAAGNTGAQGGAVYNSGTLTVSNTTFSSNLIVAYSTGSYGGGGAIFNAGSLTVTNSTFSANTGVGLANGGAIYSVGSMSIANSIFSGDGPNECSGTGCPVDGSNGNIVDLTGLLAPFTPLGYYGGAMPTLLPLPGSIAICGGIANAITTDERGYSRTPVYAAGCYDSGAVQTDYALQFVTQPVNTPETQIMSPGPAVQITERGVPFVAVDLSIPLTLTTGPGALTGGTAVTAPSSIFLAASGTATYNDLSINQIGNNDVLTAKVVLNGTTAVTAASNPFNITAETNAVTGLTPSSGSTSGGTVVVINGTGFTGATSVTFGGAAATFSVVNSTQITATSPAGILGSVDVVVTSPAGVTPLTPYDVFTYQPSTESVLTFAPIAAHTFGDSPFAVSATSASSGAVSYAVASGPATVSGNVVTLTGAGTVVLSATQAASGSYLAQSATTSFTVAATNPNLTITPIASQAFGTAPFTVSATSLSSSAVSFAVSSGPAVISGNTVTLTGGGIVIITATQAALGNYAAAQAQTSFTVTAPVALTWQPGATQVFSGTLLGPLVLDATSTAGSTITYTAALQPSGSPSAVTASTVLAAGTYTLTATAKPPNSSGYTTAKLSVTFTVVNMNIFVGNPSGSVTSVYQNGTVQSGPTSGGGTGVAVDAAGYVWSINANGGGLTRFTDAGVVSSVFDNIAGLNTATVLAIDGSGVVWVTNGNGSVSALTNAGTPALSAPIAFAAGLNAPASINIDPSGSLWIANSGNNTVTEVIGVAAPLTTPTTAAVAAGSLGTKP